MPGPQTYTNSKIIATYLRISISLGAWHLWRTSLNLGLTLGWYLLIVANLTQQLNNQQMNQGMLNANSLIAHQPAGRGAKAGQSFASELSELKAAQAQVQTRDSLAPQQEQQTNTPNLGLGGQLKSQLKDKLTKQLGLEQKETLQQNQKSLAAQESTRDSQEAVAKYTTSEAQAASVAQANHKQVTEAAMEGNTAAQEQRQQQGGGDRKQQLANWDELAPRIMEDHKNKAVRIDIPGISDIQSLIVRMDGNKVSVQAVGSEKAMSSLQQRESELKARMAKKNVLLSDLRAMDASKVRGM